jgi:hypothetical protein
MGRRLYFPVMMESRISLALQTGNNQTHHLDKPVLLKEGIHNVFLLYITTIFIIILLQ